RPDLPPDLVQLVMKLMAKKPENRYQTAAEMLRDLTKLKEALQASSVAVSQSELPTTAAAAVAATNGNAGAGAVATASTISGSIVRVPLRGLARRLGGRALA